MGVWIYGAWKLGTAAKVQTGDDRADPAGASAGRLVVLAGFWNNSKPDSSGSFKARAVLNGIMIRVAMMIIVGHVEACIGSARGLIEFEGFFSSPRI